MVVLEGSCHCGQVAFTVESHSACPFMVCHCGICRKTQGPYNPNLGGKSATLKVLRGEAQISTYRSQVPSKEDPTVMETSAHERKFCSNCGTHLWAYNPTWSDLVHPVASAIDNVDALPEVPERVHIMNAYRAPWVLPPPESAKVFPEYPKQSLEDWHREHGLWDGKE